MSDTMQIRLAKRPIGAPALDDFTVTHEPVAAPAEGEVLVRTLFLSLDPYMRGRMSDAKSYAQPVPIGGVMEGEVVGQIVRSAAPNLAEGTIVTARSGWQTDAVHKAEAVHPLDLGGAPLSTALGTLGMPGLTAYVGVTRILELKPGQTLVVSAASGAVGSVVGQWGKRLGARVIGIAGGPDKCAYITEVLGFDAAVDHRTDDLGAALDHACPDGIDADFENVGGKVLQAIVPRLAIGGRIAVCGLVAQYDENLPGPGPNPFPLLRRRARIEGFIVSDHYDLMPVWRALAAPLIRSGTLKYREDVAEGLESAPAAFLALLKGGNFGKMLVKVASPAG